MRLLRWEALCAIVAFALTQTFLLVPGPYAMALFTFIAQPLFAIVAIGYLLKVRADLRKRLGRASNVEEHLQNDVDFQQARSSSH